MADKQVKSSYYKKKFYFAIQERILLHLARYSGYEEEVEVPDALTQFGIAGAAGAGRSTCSKLLQGLEGARLIVSRRAHVPSGHIRRTVYFLTLEGAAEAEAIRARVEDSVVVLRRSGGDPRKVRVGDIAREVPVYADFVEIASHVSRGSFDLDSFVTTARARAEPAEVLEGMPRVDHFHGRREELKALVAWWEAPGGRPLVLTGPAGIGKSAVAARLVAELRSRTHVLWYRVHPGSSPRELAGKLAEFLAKMHRKELSLHLESRAAPRPREVLYLAARGLVGPPALLVLDGVDGAPTTLVAFARDLLVALGTRAGPRIMIIARSAPKALIPDGMEALEVSLAGLDKMAAAKLLALRGIPEDLQGEVHRRTHGNPLFLRLVSHDIPRGPLELDSFLKSTILPGLLQQERLVLARAAVDRRPLPEGALAAIPGLGNSLVRSLVDLGLLGPVEPMALEIPGALRGTVLEGLPARVLGMLRREAADYWASQPTPWASLEAVHHLAAAGEVRRALTMASRAEPTLTSRGLAEDLIATLGEVTGVRGENRLIHGLLLGRLLRLTGKPSAAMEELGKATTAALRSGREDLGVLLLLETAEACLALGTPNDALRDAGRALRILEGMGVGREEVLRAHHLAAVAEIMLTDPSAAVRHLRAAARLRPRGPSTMEADILLTLSWAYAQKGNGRKAVSYAIRAMRVLEKGTDLRAIARTQLLLGHLTWLTGIQARASKFITSAREVAQRIGDLELAFEANAQTLLLDPAGVGAPAALEEMREIVSALEAPLASRTAVLEALAHSARSTGSGGAREFLQTWEDLVAKGCLQEAATLAIAGAEALARSNRPAVAATLLERARAVVPAALEPLASARIEALRSTTVPTVIPRVPTRPGESPVST